MTKKRYIYLINIDMVFEGVPKESVTRVVLDPYSSFDKADKATEMVYNQCIEESKKYPRSNVSEKKLVTSKFDEQRSITVYEWIVRSGLVEEKYTARIKKLEVQ